jgi:hypothetical protein
MEQVPGSDHLSQSGTGAERGSDQVVKGPSPLKDDRTRTSASPPIATDESRKKMSYEQSGLRNRGGRMSSYGTRGYGYGERGSGLSDVESGLGDDTASEQEGEDPVNKNAVGEDAKEDTGTEEDNNDVLDEEAIAKDNQENSFNTNKIGTLEESFANDPVESLGLIYLKRPAMRKIVAWDPRAKDSQASFWKHVKGLYPRASYEEQSFIFVNDRVFNRSSGADFPFVENQRPGSDVPTILQSLEVKTNNSVKETIVVLWEWVCIRLSKLE